MAFVVDQEVDVRANKEHAWRPGVVTVVDSERKRYTVELDTPVTADEWSGVTRKLGGNLPVTTVHIQMHVHDVTHPGEHIRVRGG